MTDLSQPCRACEGTGENGTEQGRPCYGCDGSGREFPRAQKRAQETPPIVEPVTWERPTVGKIVFENLPGSNAKGAMWQVRFDTTLTGLRCTLLGDVATAVFAALAAAEQRGRESERGEIVKALSKFVPDYEPWMGKHADGTPLTIHRTGNTFGDLRAAHAAIRKGE